MLMSVVELRYEGTLGDRKWVCYFDDLEGDRDGNGFTPDAYYNRYFYPRRLGKQKALEKLVRAMIADRRKRIKEVNGQIKKLEQLTCPQRVS